MKTLSQWRDVASYAFAWKAGQEPARDRIVFMCWEAEQSGGQICAWHAAAIIHGCPCNCVSCQKQGRGVGVFA